MQHLDDVCSLCRRDATRRVCWLYVMSLPEPRSLVAMEVISLVTITATVNVRRVNGE